MDDLANWLPARLSWLLLSAAAWLLRADYRQALCIGWRDRYQHASPNCAWSEATVAGALGVRLGGRIITLACGLKNPGSVMNGARWRWMISAHYPFDADGVVISTVTVCPDSSAAGRHLTRIT